MNEKLVSIIITTKNEQPNLGNCLESIKNQIYRNIEIIVVDNNSSDKTVEIANKFTGLVFNKGPERSAQRNYGAEKSKGDFLVFIDADMILTPKVISECVIENQKSRPKDDQPLAEKVESQKLGGVVIPEKSIGKGYWADVKAFERSLYEGDSSIEAARFFSRDVFEEFSGYDEGITGPEDWDLPARVSRKYAIGRITSYIHHDEGRVSLFTLMKKKYYYGLKASKYIGKHRNFSTVSQVIYFLRPAFYKNIKKLCLNPSLSIGMVIMLACEQMSGLLGVIQSIVFKD